MSQSVQLGTRILGQVRLDVFNRNGVHGLRTYITLISFSINSKNSDFSNEYIKLKHKGITKNNNSLRSTLHSAGVKPTFQFSGKKISLGHTPTPSPLFLIALSFSDRIFYRCETRTIIFKNFFAREENIHGFL